MQTGTLAQNKKTEKPARKKSWWETRKWICKKPVWWRALNRRHEEACLCCWSRAAIKGGKAMCSVGEGVRVGVNVSRSSSAGIKRTPGRQRVTRQQLSALNPAESDACFHLQEMLRGPSHSAPALSRRRIKPPTSRWADGFSWATHVLRDTLRLDYTASKTVRERSLNLIFTTAGFDRSLLDRTWSGCSGAGRL